MSRESKPVVSGDEASVDRSTLKLLCVILMLVFAVGIALYGTVAADAMRSGSWTEF